MSEKKIDCSHHRCNKREKRYRQFALCFLTFLILILLAILLVWLIIRPTKPRFTLEDATVYAFNVTPSFPNSLTSNIQLTVSSRNPMDKVGIYYSRMDIYATYRNQQITVPTLLPPTYQGHKDIVIWSPFVNGNGVPVAPYLFLALNQDQEAGVILIHVKIDGKIKWKVGSWMSGGYHLHVNCPAYITFGSQSTGWPVGNHAIKYQLVQKCSVDVDV